MSSTTELPGINERGLAEKCPVCGKHILEGSDLSFYRVTIEHCVLDVGAIRRRAGMAIAIGNNILASVMGPDNDLAKVFDGPMTYLVHESCALHIPIAVLMEDKNEDKGIAE